MHMPLWDNTPMKPFWVSDSTFTFWPYLLCWATALFCASVCVCVCTLSLSMSVHILHPRISIVVLFEEILPLSMSSSRREAVIKGEIQLSRLN